MRRSGFRSAGFSSVVGSLSSAVAIFVIFRAGVEFVGAAAVGAWALLQGLFFFARIADSGVGVNLTRSYALAEARGETGKHPYVLAGWIAGTLPVLVSVAVTFVPIVRYVSAQSDGVLSGGDVGELALLCAAFGVLGSAAAVVLAICEGARLVVAKNVVVVLGNALAVAVAYATVPTLGIAAIGWAYVVSASVQLFGGLLILWRSADPGGSTIGTLVLLRRIWRENIQLMSMAVTRLSFEPTSKFFLSLVAPLAFLAAFDLALKLTSQVRIVFQAALQPIIAFAPASSDDAIGQDRRAMFRRAGRSLGSALWLAFDVMTAGALVLTYVAFGEINLDFVGCYLILNAANMVNAGGLVGYFVMVSSGQFGKLLSIQVRMAVINLILSVAAWLLGAPWLVVVGLGAVLAYGGVALMAEWRRLDTLETLGVGFAARALVSSTVIALVFTTLYASGGSAHGLVVGVLLLFCISLLHFRSARALVGAVSDAGGRQA